MVGGYTKFRAVENEDVSLFTEAMRGLLGVEYEPLIVATQVVAGTNYKFICNATSVTLPPRNYVAEVIIYQPVPSQNEQNVVTYITEVNV